MFVAVKIVKLLEKIHGKKLKPSELVNDIASPQTRYILFLIVGGDGVK